MSTLKRELTEHEKALASTKIENDRFELFELPRYRFEMQRREFFKIMGAGVAVVVALRNAAFAQGPGADSRIPQDIGAWIHVGEDGKITAFSGKVEIGQNNTTAFTQLVAEELHAPIGQVEVIMADTGRTPWDRGTIGSESMPILGAQFRRAAASARQVIVARAAQQWNVDAARLVARDGRVSDPTTNRSASYGEIVQGQELTEVIPAEPVLDDPAGWTVAGTDVPKVNARAFVTGAHKYVSDMKLPGMLYGRVLRAPAYGATMESVDTSAAEAMPGVTVVRDGEFVGVTAPTRGAADRALAVIQVTWREETPQPSNAEIFEYLKANSEPSGQEEGDRGTPHMNVWNAGSVEQGLANAEQRVSQTYTIRYVAHSPLETRTGLAQWEGDRLTVWTGTQRPFGVQTQLARLFRIPEQNVRVIAGVSSPGYGGKHTSEAGEEAARLARTAGRPVKVHWSREEEMWWAYFRPAGIAELRSGVSADGRITAWEFHNYNSGDSALGSPYNIANKHHEYHRAERPLRQGSYRGLAATFNHFARESHMDELAHAASLDPVEFRRRNIDDPRLMAVLDEATKAFGWGKAKTIPGQGFGVAAGMEKLGYMATCVEVRVDQQTGAVKVEHVLTAFEAGAIVNPTHLKNQVEGAVMYGLGGALFEEIEFDSGRIRNGRFSQYRLPRFSDMPRIESVLINRTDIPPGGAGETPMFGLAPAIANAIFNATGLRVRSMPLARNNLDLSATQSRASA